MAGTDKPDASATERRIQQGQEGSPNRVPDRRGRTLRDRFRRDFMRRTLDIGVSARIFHPEPGATGLRSKNLQYLEGPIARWVMSRDVLEFMVPTVNTNGLRHPGNIGLRHYARHLDGLVLQGGADVSPQAYSEAATRPEWGGDRARDLYQFELPHEFVDAGKPVRGICRGCQRINVAFGGRLCQDVATNVPDALAHVHNDDDAHRHAIVFPPGSSLGKLFPRQARPVINSIHHQAVKQPGRDIAIEAMSDPDGIVEAIRYQRADPRRIPARRARHPVLTRGQCRHSYTASSIGLIRGPFFVLPWLAPADRVSAYRNRSELPHAAIEANSK
jgi:gamma-glutamyl-gamma-aminobutyrate hydrolase PuuD